MIRIGQIARAFLESGPMSWLIGLFVFLDEHTFLTKSGDGVVFRLSGVDAECIDHAERDQIARRFEGAVRTLDERFRLYQYLLKRGDTLGNLIQTPGRSVDKTAGPLCRNRFSLIM